MRLNRFLYQIILNKSFLINLFFYKNYYNILIFQKINLYKNILKFYKFDLHFSLVYAYQFKYSWIETKSKFEKLYVYNYDNFNFVEFFQKVNKNYIFQKHDYINNYIKFKNKFGFFKKISSVKNVFLQKNNIFKNTNIDYINKLPFNNNLSFKNFDFAERKLSFFKNNRKILKNIFKKNKKIEFYMNRFLKKISKVKFSNYLNIFEFSIINVLLNSNFFLNKNDIFFFIKNKFVFVNNKIVSNGNYVLKNGDVVNICFNKYYYFLYRKYLNNLTLNLNKYNNFYKKNNFNLKNDFNFVNKIIFLKNDVPNYLEVDYISMSLILLYNNVSNYNCFDLKLLNGFLKRLNTWKYII